MKNLFPLIPTLILASCSSVVENDVSRYRIVTDSVSWTEASVIAHEEGGHLATFSNWADLDHLISTRMPEYRSHVFWIGLSDVAEEGVWRWVDGSLLQTGMLSSLNIGGDAAERDYAHITRPGHLGSRNNSGNLPRGNTVGSKQVDGYVIEFEQ